MMNIKIQNNIAICSGTLDETATYDLLNNAFAPMLLVIGGQVTVDLSAVERSNSLGLLNWFKFVQSSDFKFTYVNAPIWLVEQFNFTDILCEKNTVSSFYAPFYCKETDEYQAKCLTLGQNIELKSNYKDESLSYSNKNDEKFEPDFEPEEYLFFLARIWKRAQASRGAA